MDIRDLRFFVLCAELGGLHRAAAQAGRGQPAFSKCIGRLEAELRTKLFVREGRSLRLTPAGETLLDHAKRLSHGLDAALREVGQVAEGTVGHVRIGSSPTAADCLLPDIFRMALGRWPRMTFDVTVGLGGELRKALRERRLDLVVGPIMQARLAIVGEGGTVDSEVMLASGPQWSEATP